MSQLCMNAIRDGVRHTGSCRSVSEGLYTLCGSRVYRLPPHVRTYLRISSRYACLPTNDRRGKPKLPRCSFRLFCVRDRDKAAAQRGKCPCLGTKQRNKCHWVMSTCYVENQRRFCIRYIFMDKRDIRKRLIAI
jgi:hypothetical protein